jgi:hypothetical protein
MISETMFETKFKTILMNFIDIDNLVHLQPPLIGETGIDMFLTLL